MSQERLKAIPELVHDAVLGSPRMNSIRVTSERLSLWLSTTTTGSFTFSFRSGATLTMSRSGHSRCGLSEATTTANGSPQPRYGTSPTTNGRRGTSPTSPRLSLLRRGEGDCGRVRSRQTRLLLLSATVSIRRTSSGVPCVDTHTGCLEVIHRVIHRVVEIQMPTDSTGMV